MKTTEDYDYISHTPKIDLQIAPCLPCALERKLGQSIEQSNFYPSTGSIHYVKGWVPPDCRWHQFPTMASSLLAIGILMI